MTKSQILTMHDTCEMTAIPGEIMECARSQAPIVILGSFGLKPKSAHLLSPIQIAAFN